jgi:hypothetical protein
MISQRIRDDIAMSKQLRGDEFGLKLIVRRWENISQEWEFRCMRPLLSLLPMLARDC